MVRRNLGRRKVEMQKISDEKNLQVTFSKRRSGIFKKASELCTLTGAEVAIIVFSPGKKTFSFGHPSMETIVDRFIGQNPPPQFHHFMQVMEPYQSANIDKLNMELNQVLDQLEFEKKRGVQLDQMRKDSQAQHWWESPVSELSSAQLDQLKASLKEFGENVTKHAENTVMINGLSPHYYMNPLDHQVANSQQLVTNLPNHFAESSSSSRLPAFGGSFVNNNQGYNPNHYGNPLDHQVANSQQFVTNLPNHFGESSSSSRLPAFGGSFVNSQGFNPNHYGNPLDHQVANSQQLVTNLPNHFAESSSSHRLPALNGSFVNNQGFNPNKRSDRFHNSAF